MAAVVPSKKTLSTWNSLDRSGDVLEMYTHSHGTGPKNGSAPRFPFERLASRHFLFCGDVRTSPDGRAWTSLPSPGILARRHVDPFLTSSFFGGRWSLVYYWDCTALDSCWLGGVVLFLGENKYIPRYIRTHCHLGGQVGRLRLRCRTLRCRTHWHLGGQAGRLRLRCRAEFSLFCTCMCASRCPLPCRRVGSRIQFPCIVATRYLLFPKQRLVCHSHIRTVPLPCSRFVAPLCCIFPSFLQRMRRNGRYLLRCQELFFASFSAVRSPLFDQPRHYLRGR